MIDLDYAIKNFHSVRNQYLSTPEMDMKKEHMLRVMHNSIFIATSLGLSEEQIALAGLIGLLHEIGRFEQYKKFSTFVDKDSVSLLFGKNYIRFFLKDARYNAIIRNAILNHDSFAIQENLEGESLLQAKILRDANHLDNYRQFLLSNANQVFESPSPTKEDTVHPNVLDSFIKEECVKMKDIRTKLDDFVQKCALVYGFSFPDISLQKIYYKEYIYRLRVKFMESFPIMNSLAMEQLLAVEFATDMFIYKKINKRK